MQKLRNTKNRKRTVDEILHKKPVFGLVQSSQKLFDFNFTIQNKTLNQNTVMYEYNAKTDILWEYVSYQNTVFRILNLSQPFERFFSYKTVFHIINLIR